jgi:hypothetical protein
MLVVPRNGGAQQNIVVSGRLSPRVLGVGPDSGKVLLMVEVAGLGPTAQMAIKRDLVKVVDTAGHAYTLTGIAGQPVESTTLVAEYPRLPIRRTPPRYLFLVPPGTTQFELRMSSIPPMRFTASVMSAPR